MTSLKRQAILAAALKIVSLHGFHGASMSMIADEAQSGAGTIYNYFSSKDELMRALFREVKADYMRSILQGIDENMPLAQSFPIMWRNAIQFNIQWPEKVAYSQQFHSSPYMDEAYQAFINEAMAPVLQSFETAMQQGIIKRIPVPILETYTLDIIASLGLRHTRGEIVLDEDLIEQTGRASWQSLLA